MQRTTGEQPAVCGEEVAMPTKPLPNNPSLANLRKRAKQLLEAARRGEDEAAAQVRAFHPDAPPAEALALHDAQLVVARVFGFASWARLKHHLEGVEVFTWDPTAGREETGSEADRLIRLACLDYGRWSPTDLAEARRLLDREPGLAQASIHAAAAVGDAAAVRGFLAGDPALANAQGGPHPWPPLLYACYSRVVPDGARSTLEAARALIEAGADPDAGFLWAGNVPPFTALTGAFGEGEDGNNQPPHPERDALARLLLEAGADPNDGQTLYNRHFRRDDGHLALLFEFGLGRDRGGPWVARFAGRMGTPEKMLVEELWAAARKNFADRVRLLVEHGADVNTPGSRDNRTPYEVALLSGNDEIAGYLAAHGARRVALGEREELARACAAGDRDQALALLAGHPELRDRLGPAGRGELVRRAVEARRPEGVRLMAELGFELDHVRRTTPMHDAAWAGDLEMVRLLVELGASTAARDAAFDATPLGWADHNHQPHVVAYLMQFAPIVEAVERGGVERVAELLGTDPSLARTTDERGDALVFRLHRRIARLPEMVALLRAHAADLAARDHQGRTAEEAMLARGDGAVADLLRQAT
jgi:ankyrin repeat protein